MKFGEPSEFLRGPGPLATVSLGNITLLSVCCSVPSPATHHRITQQDEREGGERRRDVHKYNKYNYLNEVRYDSMKITTCSMMILQSGGRPLLACSCARRLAPARDTSIFVGRLAVQSVEEPREPPAILILPTSRHVLQRPQLVQDPLLLYLLGDDVLLDGGQFRRAFRPLEGGPVILTPRAQKQLSPRQRRVLVQSVC